MTLGNMAISAYVIWQIVRLPQDAGLGLSWIAYAPSEVLVVFLAEIGEKLYGLPLESVNPQLRTIALCDWNPLD
jgi:hypothetical protein